MHDHDVYRREKERQNWKDMKVQLMACIKRIKNIVLRNRYVDEGRIYSAGQDCAILVWKKGVRS